MKTKKLMAGVGLGPVVVLGMYSLWFSGISSARQKLLAPNFLFLVLI